MKLTGIVGRLKKERNRTQMELERLDAPLAALGSLKGSLRGVRTKRRTMSALARRRTSAAQRARWAKLRGSKRTTSKEPIPIRSKLKISAVGLARIRAAQRARWAKWNQQQKAA